MLNELKVNKKRLFLKLSFFLFDCGISPINPFLLTIAKQRGIPVFVIGIIFTVMPIFNVIVRPITGYVTDRWQCRKKVFLGASLLNALFSFLIYFTPDFQNEHYAQETDIFLHWKFWIFWAVITIRMLLWMIGDVLQDTICLEILGDDKKSYGNQRVWGAVGWGISTFLVGACVDWFSKNESQKNYLPAYLIAVVFLICHFIVGLQLECNQNSPSENMTGNMIKILSDVKVCLYLVWAVFAGIFTSFIWFFLFLYIEDLANIYHQERLPYIKTIQGSSIAIQCCIGEIPIYIFSGYLLKRIGSMNAFSISFGLFAVRFFAYSIIKDPLWVLPIELSNGVTFAIAFLAGIAYAAEIAPSGSEGTLQGLFGMAFHGIGVSSGSFMAGYTFEEVGSQASFRLLSYVALFVFLTQVTVNQIIRMRRPEINTDKSKEIIAQVSDKPIA